MSDLEVQADWLEEQGAFEKADDLRTCPWEIGKCYFFRLATYAWCGRVVAVGLREIVLEDASYVFQTGRFTNAMRAGLEAQQSSEIEPVDGRVIIGRGALVDCCEYRHNPPRQQK